MRRGREAAGSTWASVWIDLLTQAAVAEASQAGLPQRTLRENCRHDSGPLIACNLTRACARSLASIASHVSRNASAGTSAAPRACRARAPNTKFAGIRGTATANLPECAPWVIFNER
jgi:hypothetical protein